MGTLCDASRLGQIEEFALAHTQGLIRLVAEGYPPRSSQMRRKHLSGFRRVYVGGRALLCRAAVAEQAMSKDRCAVNRGHARGRRNTCTARARVAVMFGGDIQRRTVGIDSTQVATTDGSVAMVPDSSVS